MKLVILGAGGYGRTVQDIAEQLGYDSIVILDDADIDCPLSSFVSFVSNDTEFIPAFGNNDFRLSWCERILATPEATLATLIHSTAYVSPRASVASGTVILPHAVVNTGVEVGTGCILNIGCLIDHDCVIEEGVHICVGAIVKGENRIPRCEKVEAGEIVERNTRI